MSPVIEQAPPPFPIVARAEAGTRLAHLRWPGVTRTQLAYYCAATGVTDPIHYDRGVAAEHGFADVVVNGSFRLGMVELVVASLWPEAELVELTCRHRGVLLVDRPVEVRVTMGERRATGCALEVSHHDGDSLTDSCAVVLAGAGG